MAAPESRGLGRGLEMLLPTLGLRVVHIPVAQVRPNRRQPRREADPIQLRQLADSIKQHGVLQPVLVTEETASGTSWYELVAGERRWRAARMAGLETIPAVIRSADDRGRLLMALTENLQREDLNPLDRAQAYADLAERFTLSQEEIAATVGKSRSAVGNTLRLLSLPEPARRALQEGRISEGHARAVLAVQDEDGRIDLLRRILQEGLSVRAAEVKKRTGKSRRRASAGDPVLEELEDKLRQALGTKVELRRSGKGGRLIIHFYSNEELEALYSAITAHNVSRETSPGGAFDPVPSPT